MSKDNEERDEQKPRFQIVDRRVLTEEDRKGTSTDLPATPSENSSSTPLIQVPGQTNVSDQDRPKLEIIGGGNPNSGNLNSGNSALGSSSLDEQPGQAVSAPSAAIDAADATETVPAAGGAAMEMDDETPMTEAEVDQMRSELEAEQFAALEQEIGRPLTDAEKDQVRTMMEREAQSMTKLEVAPILLKTITELPRYAAVHLGLVANPYTGLVARNDAEARLSIEAFEALYDTVKTRLDARTNGELERVLNDLKSNYARISGAPIAPKGGPRIIR